MNIWKDIIDVYTNRPNQEQPRWNVMRDLASRLAGSPQGGRFFPGMCHDTLILSSRKSEYLYCPFVSVTPSHDVFEIELSSDRDTVVETELVPLAQVQGRVDDLMDKCIRLKEQGPSRGMPLLCDITGVLIETKVYGVQKLFVLLERGGAVNVKGEIANSEHKDDLFIFTVPTDAFDRIMYFAKGEWLQRAGIFDRQGGKVVSVLTVGFRLVDETERILSFVSPSETPEAPDDIQTFVEIIAKDLAPYLNTTASKN